MNFFDLNPPREGDELWLPKSSATIKMASHSKRGKNCAEASYVISDRDTLTIGISDVVNLIKAFRTIKIDHQHDVYHQKHDF